MDQESAASLPTNTTITSAPSNNTTRYMELLNMDKQICLNRTHRPRMI
ncbi:7016_t:CDS:2 [Acaulospora colombiana]|uniref:7016_t:CDS:1 n=1 Tax=Acaulospora colombiana TaxID=27376 RepID=A0ACA9JZ27_9GLOM|nr:7016_t:CDS:2 [Acaulospora colombiana]